MHFDLITIAVPTWNRAPQLKKCLTAMTQLEIPSGQAWEVLVVDNNSNDETPDVIRSFNSKLPIRSVFEKRAGSSHARNAAAANAKGEYLFFTDDDVAVDRLWVSAYLDAIRKWPNVSFFGGPVTVEFEGSPPAWLLEVAPKVQIAYAARDLGTVSYRFDADCPAQFPFGANYVVRRADQLRFPYDPNLGPRPGRLMLGEETAVMKAMLDGGCEGRWVPEARVRHQIPAYRQNERYLLRRYAYSGKVATIAEDKDYSHGMFGVPAWVWSRMLSGGLRYYFSRRIDPPNKWIDALIDFGFTLGVFSAWAQRSSLLRHFVK